MGGSTRSYDCGRRKSRSGMNVDEICRIIFCALQSAVRRTCNRSLRLGILLSHKSQLTGAAVMAVQKGNQARLVATQILCRRAICRRNITTCPLSRLPCTVHDIDTTCPVQPKKCIEPRHQCQWNQKAWGAHELPELLAKFTIPLGAWPGVASICTISKSIKVQCTSGCRDICRLKPSSKEHWLPNHGLASIAVKMLWGVRLLLSWQRLQSLCLQAGCRKLACLCWRQRASHDPDPAPVWSAVSS